MHFTSGFDRDMYRVTRGNGPAIMVLFLPSHVPGKNKNIIARCPRVMLETSRLTDRHTRTFRPIKKLENLALTLGI